MPIGEIEMKRYIKFGLIILGAIVGYGYYYYIGCRSGVCPITSNPWISTGYGALIGFVAGMGNKSNSKSEAKEN